MIAPAADLQWDGRLGGDLPRPPAGCLLGGDGSRRSEHASAAAQRGDVAFDLVVGQLGLGPEASGERVKAINELMRAADAVGHDVHGMGDRRAACGRRGRSGAVWSIAGAEL